MAEIFENNGAAVQTAEVPEGEGIAEGVTPEITEENLFELVDAGEISLEDANRFLDGETGEVEKEQEAAESTEYGQAEAESSSEEPDSADKAQGFETPYRVFQKEEDFQRVFDNAWNKRYGKMMHERDTERTAHQELLSDLGSLLGVSPEQAAQELKNRKRRLEAERSGVDPEEYTARAQAEEERDYYKKQVETQQSQARAREVIARIRAQGEVISAQDPTFHIDEAMNNPEFAQVVFALSPVQPAKAVEMAYRTVYKKSAPAPAVTQGKGAVSSAPARPREGGLSGMRQERRPVDYGRMSDKDILSIADRVMRGEKVDM